MRGSSHDEPAARQTDSPQQGKTVEEMKRALYEALKLVLPKDMSDFDFDLFCVLEDEYAV